MNTKAEDRRSALIERLLDHVLTEGLRNATLRPLAKAAGTSDRMLLYYFKDKDELVSAVLERAAARLAGILSEEMSPRTMPLPALKARLTELVTREDIWPYMRLGLDIASLSAGGDPLYRAVGYQIGLGFLEWAKAQLKRPPGPVRDREAAELLTFIEGVLYLHAIGLTAIPKLACGLPADQAPK